MFRSFVVWLHEVMTPRDPELELHVRVALRREAQDLLERTSVAGGAAPNRRSRL